jgi:hypothetical protein
VENRTKWLIGIILFIILVFVVVLVSVQNFGLDRLEYRIDSDGDAVVLAEYHLNIIEKFWLMFPSTREGIIRIIKDEYGPESEVIQINDNHTQFTIPKWATKLDNTTVQSPETTYLNVKSRMEKLWFAKLLNVDYSPTYVILVGPDESTKSYTEAMTIPAITWKI